MSTNLRRVLDTTRIQDRMKVLELVHEIQAAAIPLRNSPPEESFFELEEHVEFSGSMSRPLWQAPESINLAAAVEVADDRISLEDLKGRGRNKEVVTPRQMAMYFLREETGASLPQIGDALGGRDHTTVIYSVEKITQEIEQDDQRRREMLAIKERLYQGLHP